jgi:glycosyltransferase involved in cell wall biosynthesis
LLEGMSGHLPVVGSSIDSLRPILEECGGKIFEVANVDSLTETIVGLLNESESEHCLEGERAYAYLCRNHNILEFRQKYRTLLEGMLVPGGRA